MSNVKSSIVFVATGLVVFNVILLSAGYSYLKFRRSASTDGTFGEKPSNTKLFTNDNLDNSPTKTILLWNLPKAVSYPTTLDPIRCGKCLIVTDRKFQNESDAVVFSFHRMGSPSNFPPRPNGNPNQVYVWLCRESPKTTRDLYKLDLSLLNNIINWTMTYRLDSDVFFPYSEILHRLHDEKLQSSSNVNSLSSSPSFAYVDLYYSSVDELVARKRYMVAWVVGNCGGTTGAKARMLLVEKMMKAGLSVHRFGKCFKDKEFPPYRSEETHERLIEFKFYLAFENTFNCKDYVTYKFWKNAIYSGSVPIVWGTSKADLERLAPKNSFIHMEDFESMMHLIYYLKYLDSNDTAYREYFRWRDKEIKIIENQKTQRSNSLDSDNTDWIFSTHEAFGYCKLCRMLQEQNNFSDNSAFKRKTVASLNDWWYGSEKESCFA